MMHEMKFVDDDDDPIGKIDIYVSDRLSNAIIVKIYSYHDDKHTKYLSDDILDTIYRLVENYNKGKIKINENGYKILIEPFVGNCPEIKSYIDPISVRNLKKCVIKNILNYGGSKKKIRISH